MRERTDGRGFATRAIHAGERPDPVTRAHKPAIYATSTFAFDTAAEKEDAVDRALAWEPGVHFYSRTNNPTNRALEEKVAAIEGAEDTVVSSSGMAAVSSREAARSQRSRVPATTSPTRATEEQSQRAQAWQTVRPGAG